MSAVTNVVILEVAWGYGGRWFRINPHNFSGRRLYQIFGAHRFLVTNACPDVVGDASGRGSPSPEHLRGVLGVLRPRFVLVCGAVADRTFAPDMVDAECTVMRAAHPAARSWTKLALEQLRTDVHAAIASREKQ